MFVIAKKKRMRMNQQTKINFILEHIAHIDDLIKDNIDEALLSASLNYKLYMKEKELPDNLEDAIILSFLYAEYFIQKILCGIYYGLLKLSWWNFNRKIK